MSELVTSALRRFRGNHVRILGASDVAKLADAIAAVNVTAELLGRSRVRELHGRAVSFQRRKRPEDVPFRKFADSPPGVLGTAQQAAEYFASLHPELGIDPKRYGEHARRSAFTLAESANELITARVQRIIHSALATRQPTADATHLIQSALAEAGISPQNPQYAEMVFRTNAADAYQQGVYEEGRHADVRDVFPVWQYVGIRDGRQGKDHEPRFDLYYPASAAFAEVRGDRPFNCRCSLRWVDKFEWEDARHAGAQAESV